MSGKAVILKQSDCRLSYAEEGTLKIGEQLLTESFRNYIYELENHIIRVFYNDAFRKNEILHELDFSPDGTASHEHVCGQDRYLIEFKFLSENLFKTHYAIKGPQKDQEIETVFTRL